MIELGKKKKETSGAISVPIKENNRDTGAKSEQKKGTTFSLFGRKSPIEEIKKKIGSEIAGPICADHNQIEAAQHNLIERYAIREPVLHVSISLDDIGSLVYLIEEPVLTSEESTIYARLMDVLQYELKAPYDGADPKKVL